MERIYFENLQEWKNAEEHKPLLLIGARQVGKTWLMLEFGKRFFKNIAYINFDENEEFTKIFQGKKDVYYWLEMIELQSGQKITPKDTLIIFDEIQECPEALTALKYFNEYTPEYHIIASGSLLGIGHHNGTGFPVGKVDFLNIFPLSFFEFLDAMGRSDFKEKIIEENFELLNHFEKELTHLLKQYFFVGGMPEAVKSFIKYKDYGSVRKIQNNILFSFEEDFSNHTSSSMAEKIKQVWNSISSQLAKENKKFIFGVVKAGARAREYDEALNWLREMLD